MRLQEARNLRRVCPAPAAFRRNTRNGVVFARNPEPFLIPGFVLAFLALAAVNSFGVIPEIVATGLGDLSRWALLIAIAAVGMKTSLRRILEVGGQAITLIVAETIFIAAFILVGIAYLA